jgi:NTP pyrophosphatase (non-canonical NTP hydrolase)
MTKTKRSQMTKKISRAQLTFAEYQSASTRTDHTGNDPQDGILVAVLGITGEAGDLATLFKKRLRDGPGFTVYAEQCTEELGDILWYMATLCTKLGLTLDEVAARNLTKTRARWEKFKSSHEGRPFLDEAYPAKERIPRLFSVTFKESRQGNRTLVTLSRDGKKSGDALTDNAHFEDGYRYHDVFHLAYAAVLGWSPITRKILGCKRRSNPNVDEIEDGGRASVIEEAVSALVFQYAEKHNMFDNVGRIDSELLTMITHLANGLEVREASAGEWEQAILLGYQIFRLLNKHRGGTVTTNLNERTLRFQKIGKADHDHNGELTAAGLARSF